MLVRSLYQRNTWSGALAAAALILLSAPQPASAALASDPHIAVGAPVAQPPLTTSTGLASEPWPDPYCPPGEGTQNRDPGVAPGSWSSLLGQILVGAQEESEIKETVKEAVDIAWAAYVKQAQTHPPGVFSLAEAEDILEGRAIGALFDQNDLEGILQRIANIYKPTSANAGEFLAHLDQYVSGVSSPACDGNDGYRLYQSIGSSQLWQLEPDGSWAKLTFDSGAPQPPERALWTVVPGSSRSYIASVPTANPRSQFGPSLASVEGELTIGTGALTHSCLTNESTTQTVSNQLGIDVYEAVSQYGNWLSTIPEAQFLGDLPKFSEKCASIPAVYTPWASGPVVPQGAFAVSNRATYIAGYTATTAAATIDRWERAGNSWLPGVAFGSPTFNHGGDDVVPRLAISGDGAVVAGCFFGGPIIGSPFESLLPSEQAGFPVRYPEIFHFTDGSITYPGTGTQDPQGCLDVSLNQSGDTVWYQQKEGPAGWWASATATLRQLPVLSLPSPQHLEATGPGGAAATYAATATDATGSLTPNCTPGSGAVFAIGSTIVKCTATNSAGTVAGSFEVTVSDTTPPVLTLPSALAVEAPASAGAIVQYMATATDLVDGAVLTTCTPSSGSVFPIGIDTVNCQAADAHGNSASASFMVTISDTTPPVFTAVPQNISLAATGPGGVIVDYPQPVASDAVDGNVAVTCLPATGSTFAIGTTTVKCTAADGTGNASSAQFDVKVTPIAIQVPSALHLSATDASGRRVTFSAKAIDELDQQKVPVRCSPASGTTFALGTVVVDCTATDANGGSSASFPVTISDTTAPKIAGVPASQLVEATGPTGAHATYSIPTATDNVDGSDAVICTPSSGSLFPLGATIVRCTASDAAANSSTKTFRITVKDTTAPTITGVPAPIFVQTTSASGMRVTYATPTAIDLVSSLVTVHCSPKSGTVFPIGTNTVACTATDHNGNVAYATFPVIVASS